MFGCLCQNSLIFVHIVTAYFLLIKGALSLALVVNDMTALISSAILKTSLLFSDIGDHLRGKSDIQSYCMLLVH